MNRQRPNEPPLPDPLAYFLTWPTYGTWLPGDKRGWVEYRNGWQPSDKSRRKNAAARMSENSCILTPDQRDVVEDTIRKHCEIRNWDLYAVNCRSNHVHIVVAADPLPKQIRSQIKAWCTRRLKEQQIACGVLVSNVREKWWAERGSARYINDQNSLEAVIVYVLEAQDSVARET